MAAKRKIDDCGICDRKQVRIEAKIDGLYHCSICYNKTRRKICCFCSKLGVVAVRNKNNEIMCKSCYEKYKLKEICSSCNILKKVCVRREEKPICYICRKKTRPKEICSVCKKLMSVECRKDKKPFCRKCYRKNKPKEKCDNCKQSELIECRKGNKSYCGNCYYRLFQPQEICENCEEKRPVAKRHKNKAYCKKCYNSIFRPIETCSLCNIEKAVHSRTNKKEAICFKCYKKNKRKTDVNYRIAELIRRRIRKAVIKKFTPKYKEIIEFLGPCPGKFEDYHIDHIFPLSAFDLTDEREIKIAFSPENHQWLTAKENIAKGNKYNKKELEIFKSKIIKKYNLDENNS